MRASRPAVGAVRLSWPLNAGPLAVMVTAPLIVTDSKSRHRGTTARTSSQFGSRHKGKEKLMKKEYDFSKGKRGAVIKQLGKSRITIYLDDAILKGFKAQSERTGNSYQTLLNDALNSHLGLSAQPLTAEIVRKIVREELSSQS
jgi:uncharacterized protein (DUF4415 family)